MNLKRKMVVAGLVTVVLAGAGAVVAYWTQGGTGSGNAPVGSSSGITVVQTSTISGLVPGGAAASLSGNVNNPNSFPVTISGVTAIVQSVTTNNEVGKPVCSVADFSIGGTAAGSVVPSGSGVGSWSGLTVSMLNTAANQDNCKNQTLTIAYTASP